MNQPALLEVLSVLTAAEKKAFDAYLQLPSIKEGVQLQQLFYQIEPFTRQETKDNQWKETVWKALYKVPFEDSQFRLQLSKLKKQVERYLVLEHLQENPVASKQLLLDILQQRNAPTAYEIALRQLQKQLTEQPTQDIVHAQDTFALYHHLHLNPNLLALSKNDDDSEKAMHSMDRLFVLGKLRYGCELLSRKKILQKDIEIKLLGEAILLANDSLFRDDSLINLYNQLVYYHQYPTISRGFMNLIDHFEHHLTLLSAWEQHFVLVNLINLANWRKELQIDGFDQILFDIYKIGLDSKILFTDGILQDTLFSNFVIMGLQLGEADYIKVFIEKYQVYLSPIYHTETVALSKGYLHFYHQNFRHAFDIIQGLAYHNQAYENRTRSLEIRCLFEIYLTDKTIQILLLKRIGSFQQHIRRKKKDNQLSPAKHIAYKNFITMTKKIKTHCDQQKTSPPHIAKLTAELKVFQQVVAYDWLLEILKGLAKNNSLI